MTYATLFVSVPVGLLTTAILHANDIRDILHDKKAGIRTLSITIGRVNAERLYCGLILTSFAAVLLMAFYRVIPVWSLACLLAFPGAFKCIKKTYTKGDTNGDIIMLDKATAQLHAQFGSILILSILLPSIIK
jgi:1,4-dihydroxy-2-naphthoate octaprenyltransferase